MTKPELIAFEDEVAAAFEAGKIRGPIHLSGGNEDEVIEIFGRVSRGDWVFSTWRSHYHALLHGVPREAVMREILAGRSMNLMFPEHRFFSSAIVAGICPIALGVAAAIKRRKESSTVWCFVGDMAARTGAFYEMAQYAQGHALPLRVVIEDNGLSTNTPTSQAWGTGNLIHIELYGYERTRAHTGTGRFVQF